MNLLPRIFLSAAIAVSFGASCVPAQALDWLKGDGRSCDAVCKKEGRQAVVSGYYKGGSDAFYVCHTDQGGGGWRPGYNLKPSWANVCMVGFGGKEVRASSYACACE